MLHSVSEVGTSIRDKWKREEEEEEKRGERREDEASHLESLSYRTDTKAGYRLSLARAKPGELNIVLTAIGVEYTAPSGGGA